MQIILLIMTDYNWPLANQLWYYYVVCGALQKTDEIFIVDIYMYKHLICLPTGANQGSETQDKAQEASRAAQEDSQGKAWQAQGLPAPGGPHQE